MTNPHATDRDGYFKMEIQFSDGSHEIDRSVLVWRDDQYTICYRSYPETLKLIMQDSGFRSSFELFYEINVRPPAQ